MNLPNKLTTIRMIIVPLIVIIYFVFPQADRRWIFALFTIGSITDFLDGYLARKYQLVTTYGKFLDPIADKLLVNTTLFILVVSSEIHPLIFLVMFARDICVDGLRMLASNKGIVIAAGSLGKLKTVFQMVALVLLLLNIKNIGNIFLILACIMSLVSGFDYIYRGRELIFESI